MRRGGRAELSNECENLHRAGGDADERHRLCARCVDALDALEKETPHCGPPEVLVPTRNPEWFRFAVDSQNGTQRTSTMPSLTFPFPVAPPSVRFSGDGSLLFVCTADSATLVWDLRALRRELETLGLDWDQLPFPPAPPVRERRLEVIVQGADPGAHEQSHLLPENAVSTRPGK